MAELKRIGSFQSFSEMRAQKQAAQLAEETASKREALKAKFAAIVDELDVNDLNVETIEEGNAFIFAASKAKQEGKEEFEFNGKKYKVTLKADTGLKESEEVVEESLEETEEEYVSEAVIVTGKRDANRVMKAYQGFFNAYPALDTTLNHVGTVKQLYRLAMEDANFGREGNATVNQMKGRLFPIDVKIADLNNTTVKIPVSKLQSLIENHANAISGAAKWSGLAIVEGTALFLDSIKQTKYAEGLLAAFNKAFESVEVLEERIIEGNAFGAARMKAIADGKDEFEFEGETYKVKDVDAEDKEAADDLANESEINSTEHDNPEGYPSPAGDSEDVEESPEQAEVEVMGESEEVNEGAREEQEAMEVYTEVAGPDGAYSEDELKKGDMDLFMDIVTAAGYKGSKAKKVADEFRKIATMESLVSENYEVIFSDGMSQMKKFRSEQQAVDFMKKEIKSNKKLRDIAVYKPGMHSTTQTELVVAFWGNGSYLDNVSKRDSDLAAKKVEESVEVNEAEVKSAEDFKEYAVSVLQQAFGEDYDEAKAMEVIDGLISKHGEDYGAMVGALQSSLGESVVNEDVFDDLEDAISDMESDAYQNLAFEFGIDAEDGNMMMDLSMRHLQIVESLVFLFFGINQNLITYQQISH